jgi:hypothetical protein
VKNEIPKSREEAFVCMFCGRAGYLDEFCFRHKRIKKRRFDYAINSYHDEFSMFSSRTLSRASSHTSSHALSYFSHGPNHRSYDFGSRGNRFVPIRFSYGPCPHHGDRFPHRPDFPMGLLDAFWPMLSVLLAIFQMESSCTQFCI